MSAVKIITVILTRPFSLHKFSMKTFSKQIFSYLKLSTGILLSSVIIYRLPYLCVKCYVIQRQNS